MIDFRTALLDPKGQPVKNGEGEEMTLAKACEMALDAPLQADAGEGLVPKLRRGRLIERVTIANEPIDLPADDIVLLKERVAGLFTAASFVRNICRLLDPATE